MFIVTRETYGRMEAGDTKEGCWHEYLLAKKLNATLAFFEPIQNKVVKAKTWAKAKEKLGMDF